MLTSLQRRLAPLLGISDAPGFDPYAPWHAFRLCPSGAHVIEAWRTACAECAAGERRDTEVVDIPVKPPALPFTPLRAEVLQVIAPEDGPVTDAMDALPDLFDPSGTVALSALGRAAPEPVPADLAKTQPIQAFGQAQRLAALRRPQSPRAPRPRSVVPRTVELTVTLPMGRGAPTALVLKDDDGAEVLTLIVGAAPQPIEGRSTQDVRVQSSDAVDLQGIQLRVTPDAGRAR